MKKKYLIISISILLVLTTCLYVFISDNNEKLIISSEENNKNILNTNALTMMYETGYQSGEYQVSSDTTWPQDGYIFNETLSRCENGSILTWNSETNGVIMQANVSDKCYVYFDKNLNLQIIDADVGNNGDGYVTISSVSLNVETSIAEYYLSINGESSYTKVGLNDYNPSVVICASRGERINYSLYVVDTLGNKSDVFNSYFTANSVMC